MSKTQAATGGNNERRVTVDIVIVGGGPATLGLLTNACKTNRLNELVAKGDGIAVIEQGMTMGAGNLEKFGVNSNTSANGFIKCLYKRREIPNVAVAQAAVNQAQQSAGGYNLAPSGSPNPKRFLKAGTGQPATSSAIDPSGSPVRPKLKDMQNQGLDEGDSEEDAQDEEDVYQPKKYEYVALNPFKDLYKHSPLIQMSFEFGPSCIPLSTVGMIMNYTGNHLLHFIHSVLGKRIFFPMHRVVSVQLMQNGDIITTAMRKEVSIVLSEEPQPDKPSSTSDQILAASDVDECSASASREPFKIVSHGEVQVTFRSKAIVLSNGGHQSIHPDFYTTWFPFLKERQDDVILSDYVLQKKGYFETVNRIKTEGKKKIVIIGGSHSGFSAAWLLLNGPADILHNTHVIPTVQHVKKNTGKFAFPGAPVRTIDQCARCCVCNCIPKKQRPKAGQCKCVCKCYGFFKYQDWGVDYDDLPQFGNADITILYRDRIRVFYSRVHQAQAEGYSDYKQLQFSNKNGFLYSFTGLRGDAKRLYKAVQSGAEKRVRLVRAPTPEDQASYLEGADLVIWACGYQTNKVPIKDIDNKLISMSAKVPFTQFDVDQRCRIITSDNGLLMKTFGTGIAYPVRTNDGMVLPEAGKVNPRADSFSLYMNYVANTLLSNLLPKQRLQNKNHRTVRMASKKTMAAQALQNERAQATLATSQAANSRVAVASAGSSNANNWIRSGSEQVSSAQRATTSSFIRPILTKPPSVAGQTTAQGVNITKVQQTANTAQVNKAPIKVTAAKPISTSNATSLALKQQSQSQSQSQSATTAGEPSGTIPEEGLDSYGQVPGYLASNYITQQRKAAKEQAKSPNPKKRAWIPSSQYLSPPTNKIPKDTMKAVELRIAAETKNQQQQQFVGLGTPIEGVVVSSAGLAQELKAPTTIQMHLSESGKAFQAVSQSFSILKSGQACVNQSINRYTLKTTEFTSKFPSEQFGPGKHPEFIKNVSASAQSYGVGVGSGQTTVATVSMLNDKGANLDRHSVYQTPQKNTSAKMGSGNIASSPLVYSRAKAQVENTPQIHKRKSSFKAALKTRDQSAAEANGGVKSLEGGQTVESLGSASASQMVNLLGQQNSAGKPVNLSMPHHETLQSSPETGVKYSDQAAAWKGLSGSLRQMASPPMETGAPTTVKPVSQSAMKRHPATAHQGPPSVTQGGKKKSASKQVVRNSRGGVSNLIGLGSNSTNHTSIMSSNQQSSTTLHKQKRAGTFLKNCTTKFSNEASSAAESKQDGQAAQMVVCASPEKNLSHLASAGQRQIFNDDANSVSSTKHAQPKGLSELPQQQLSQVDNSKQVPTHQAGSAIVSRTATSLNKQQKTEYEDRVSSGTTTRNSNMQITEDNRRNMPLSGNFVTSEDLSAASLAPAALPNRRASDLAVDLKQLQQQNSDFLHLKDREFSELRQTATNTAHMTFTKSKRDGIVAEHQDVSQGNNQSVQDPALVVNRTTGFARPTQGLIQSNGPELSPVSPAGNRPSSRQMSASRTQRSQVVNANAQITSAQSFNDAPGGRRGTNLAQNVCPSSPQSKPYMQPQQRDQSFDNGIYSLSGSNKQDMRGVTLQNAVFTQNQRKLSHNNVPESRQVFAQGGASLQAHQNTVPVKVFQLPVNKTASVIGQANAALLQSHYMQQVIFSGGQNPMSQQLLIQQQMSQGASKVQPTGSPLVPHGSQQYALASHKKNLSHNVHFTQGVQPKAVSLVPQGTTMTPHAASSATASRNAASPPHTIKVDPHSGKLMVAHQHGSSPFGFIQMVASHGSTQIACASSAGQSKQTLVQQNSSQNAYQGHRHQKQMLEKQQAQNAASPGTNFVRKPLVSSLHTSSPMKTTAATKVQKQFVVSGSLQQQTHHHQPQAATFSPIKLTSQKPVQNGALAYSPPQQMHYSHHPSHQQQNYLPKPQAASTMLVQQPRKFDITQPVALKTRPAAQAAHQ